MIEQQCKEAYVASKAMAVATTRQKNQALKGMAKALLEDQYLILEANGHDLEKGRASGLSVSLLDRLALNEERLSTMAQALEMMAGLTDPIGEILSGWTVPSGLNISKIRVPLGVVGIIYEARPNVTADAVGLCIKTGNGVVLRGSSTAYASNLAICQSLIRGQEAAGLPVGAIQLLSDVSREGVTTFVQMKAYLSVIIPRGGADLIQSVVQSATVPTIETGVGNCHIFVDASADLEKARAIIINAKAQRPSVCNACEKVLVHQAIAERFLPMIWEDLQKVGVEVRGCDQTKQVITGVTLATSDDWGREYLDLILAIKVVSSLSEAIDHIGQYGTQHTEAILTRDLLSAQRFQASIDAAAVVVNASTRFTDGGEFGFGAEVGISTQKLHARGPMGLPELTTYKYLVVGQGQVRS